MFALSSAQDSDEAFVPQQALDDSCHGGGRSVSTDVVPFMHTCISVPQISTSCLWVLLVRSVTRPVDSVGRARWCLLDHGFWVMSDTHACTAVRQMRELSTGHRKGPEAPTLVLQDFENTELDLK